MAYISPRSPPSATHNSIRASSQGIDDGIIIHSNSSNTHLHRHHINEKSVRHERAGADSPPSDGSPAVAERHSSREQRGRGRSRDKRASSKDRDSPDTLTSLGAMKPPGKDVKKNGLEGDDSVGDKANTTARIVARRRPSPKRVAAPCPPSTRSCPSPAPKLVSTRDVSPADVEGWLLDQLRGRQVWCVLSDMLFCVFEQPGAATSKQVLVLPGCSVRVLEFKSAHLHLTNKRWDGRVNSTTSSTSVSSSNAINNDKNNNNKNTGDISCTSTAGGDNMSSNSETSHTSPALHTPPDGSTKGSISSTVSNNSVTSGGSTDHNNMSSNSKTVSGVNRFQFVIENTVTRQRHMFAVVSRAELELWTQALQKACSLDISTNDNGSTTEERRQSVQGKSTKDGRSSTTNESIILSEHSPLARPDTCENLVSNGNSTAVSSPRIKTQTCDDPISPSYTPRQTLPSRLDMLSLSLSLTQPHDVSKESVDEIRRKLKKDNNNLEYVESKPIPLKATHQLDKNAAKLPYDDVDTSTSLTANGTSRKGRQFFKGRSPLDVLLGRKKRSSSADDACSRNRKMFPVYQRSEDSLSTSSFSPRRAPSTGSQQSLESSQSSHRARDSSFSTSSSVDSRGNSPRVEQTPTKSAKSPKSSKPRGGILARSWDPDMKTSRGFGASIRRTASDLKERVFGSSSGVLSSSSSQQPNDRSKPPGLKLKDLMDARVKGHLQYRVAFKFTKVFCVLSKGCFYAFKSEKPEEVPLLAMVLSPCTVTYVVESELELHRKKSRHRLNQRLFAFKLSQPHCKSIYACADNHHSLLQWMMALQTEASRVQVDDGLAAEIREKSSSLKKRQDKELRLQVSAEGHYLEHSSLKQSKQGKQLNHRHSCPTLDRTNLILTSTAQENGSRDQTRDGSVTLHGEVGSSYLPHNCKQSNGEKSLVSTLHKSKSSRDVSSGRSLGQSNQEEKLNPEQKHKATNGRQYSAQGQGREALPVPGEDDGYGTSHQRSGRAGPSDKDFSARLSAPFPPRAATEMSLRLDLSGLQNDNHNQGLDTVPSTKRTMDSDLSGPSSHGEGEISHGGATDTTAKSSLFSPSAKHPGRAGVKRTSSLDSSSVKASLRRVSLKSTLRPSQSRTPAGMNAKSTPITDTSEHHTSTTHLTSFFSTPEADVEQEDFPSPYTKFPGYRENPSHGNITETNMETDIISPPPLFRSSEERNPAPSSSQEMPELSQSLSAEVYRSPDVDPAMPRNLPFLPATDTAVKEVWSRDTDYLLSVLRDKLRRRQRQPEPGPSDQVIIENGPVFERPMATETADVDDVMRQQPDQIRGDTEPAMELEGLLERRYSDGSWNRVLCALKEPSFLVCSCDTDNHVTPEVIDLTGYDITELIDQFRGKRFVLRLEHHSEPPVLLSLDSREDLILWKHSLQEKVWASNNVKVRDMPTSESSHLEHRSEAPPSEELRPRTSSGSAQSIKQKLLAEMLRQRVELERMQAVRAEMKAGPQSQTDSPLALDEDRIVALTRLRQRRMSTQIKLQTIQRQMETSQSPSPRDKKSMFLPLGRKRAPDLLQQHSRDGDTEESRTTLEAQVRSLSSRLHDLDEDISSHVAGNSREDSTHSVVSLRNKHSLAAHEDVLRHSLDPSCLTSGGSHGGDGGLRDSVFMEDDHSDVLGGVNPTHHQRYHDSVEVEGGGKSSRKDNRGREGKDATARSTSGGFKSSVQKLAHRTFSRAGWNWAGKKAAPTSPASVSSPCAVKDGFFNNNNNTITSIKSAEDEEDFYRDMTSPRLSESTPDVIDMTRPVASHAEENRHQTSRDDLDIQVKSDTLHTYQCGHSNDVKDDSKSPHQAIIVNKGHRTPKDRIISTMVSSSSLSGVSRFDGRLQNFSSSSPDLARNDSQQHSHLISASDTAQGWGQPRLKGTGHVTQSWRPSNLTLSTFSRPCGQSSNTITSSHAVSETKVVTPRREVNPDALAQIEAFEELSLKYLGPTSK